jgi:hypothetical protein
MKMKTPFLTYILALFSGPMSLTEFAGHFVSMKGKIEIKTDSIVIY